LKLGGLEFNWGLNSWLFRRFDVVILSDKLECFILGYGLEIPNQGEYGRSTSLGQLSVAARDKCGECSTDRMSDALYSLQSDHAELKKFVYDGPEIHAVRFDRNNPKWREFLWGYFNVIVSPAGRRRFEQLSEQLQDDDGKFARMAIDEARKSVSEQDGRPHPLVGAVVVKNGQVLSVAHRGEPVGNHAEYIALEKKLPDEVVAGATVYTTLEPCTTRNHPKIPCVRRLIERRVARVVIGMLDPNPEIRGMGEQLLNEAGIETQLFPRDLRNQIEEMNCDFIINHKERQSRANTSPPKTSSEPEANPKVAEIIKHKGETVTVFNRQKHGHGYLEGFWANGAVVVDCTPLWVVLADPVAKNQQSFSLANVEVAFDCEKNRLQLTLYR